MADGVLTLQHEPRQRRLLPVALSVRWRLLPWWARVVAVYALSRVVTTGIMLAFAAAQPSNAWTGSNPRYSDFANIWDGRWYEIISVTGYPSVLPMGSDGHVAQNAWAFLPGFPAVVRGLELITGQPWAPLAVFVSLVFGLAAALTVYRLMLLRLGPSTSLFAVTIFCFAPLSPMFQVAYAESMYLFLLALSLYLLLKRRYWLLWPVIAVMAFTRPSALAFALTLAFHAAHRFLTRERDPFPTRERIAISLVAIWSGLLGIAWPLIAWGATGDAGAYTDTELSWRAAYIGYTELIPFTAWFQAGEWWIRSSYGYVVVAALIVGFAGVLFLPAVRRLGVDLRFWLASYGLYLLAVFFPQSSTFRLLAPMFPLAGAMAQPQSRIYRTLLIAACIAGQWAWLYICWWIDGYDWTPP